MEYFIINILILSLKINLIVQLLESNIGAVVNKVDVYILKDIFIVLLIRVSVVFRYSLPISPAQKSENGHLSI